MATIKEQQASILAGLAGWLPKINVRLMARQTGISYKVLCRYRQGIGPLNPEDLQAMAESFSWQAAEAGGIADKVETLRKHLG